MMKVCRHGRWGAKRLVVLFFATIALLFVLLHLKRGPHPTTTGLFGRDRWNGRRSKDSVVGVVVDGSIPEEHSNCSCFQSNLRRHENLNHERIAIKPTLQNMNVPSAKKSDIGSANLSAELKEGKYLSEPIDPHTYSYLHNPTRTCFHQNGSQAGIYLLFIVPSAPGNFKRREAIRSSYGNATVWPIVGDAGTKTVFLLATTNDRGIQDRLDKEAGAYSDIVQEDFVDSYLNLTRKTVIGLKWAMNHCRHALYVMKLDDDIAVNLPRIVAIIGDAPRVNFSTGFVKAESPVVRDPKSKWFLSKVFYPDSKYPPHLIGAAYILSADVVESVFHTAIALPLFPWEDVFIGMCLQNLEVKLLHDNKFLFWGNPKEIVRLPDKHDKCPKKYAIFYNLSVDYIRKVFDACRKQIRVEAKYQYWEKLTNRSILLKSYNKWFVW